jgi:hypothetical protein
MLAVLASTAMAQAQDDAATVLNSVRERMRLGDWDTAHKELKELLARGPEVPGLRGLLPDVEQQLKVCLYRKDAPRPTAKNLFGPGGMKVAAYGRRIELAYPDGPTTETGWVKGSDGLMLLPIRFEKDVTLELDAEESRGNRGNQLVVFWDPDKGTGLSFQPGCEYGEGSTMYSVDVQILSLRGDEKPREILKEKPIPKVFGARAHYEIQCKNSALQMEWFHLYVKHEGLDSTGPKRKVKGRSTDATEGLIALRAWDPRNVVIKGVVTDLELNSRIAKFHDSVFEQWEKTTWNRDAVMPAWALKTATVAATRFVPPLPRGVEFASIEPLLGALEAYHLGNYPVFVAKAAPISGGRDVAAKYLQALLQLVSGAPASAEEKFTAILESQPDFAAAHVGRAQARYERRDIEGARVDLDSAGKAGARQPEYYFLRATLAVLEGALATALEACDEARDQGALLGELVPLDACVRRTVQGPSWQRRFEYRNDNAVVYSDQSFEVCRDVGVLIGTTMQECRKVFLGKRTMPPIRVFVFSGRESYMKYAADAGSDIEHSAGTYIPFTREIVLCVPEIQGDSFWRTVKHETFHAFLHGLTEGAPPWYSEGWALWFENGRSRGEATLVDGVSADRIETIRQFGGVKILAPLEKFMVMEPKEFTASARLHYAQAEALIQFLNKEKSRWKQPLRQYGEGLFSGQSAQEAYDVHWKHLIFDMQREFFQFVDDILRK